MTIKTNRLLVCALLAFPTTSLAQDISGAATLGYGHSTTSDGGGDLNSYTLDGIGKFAFQNGWSIGAEGSFVHADPDGGSGDINVSDLGLRLQYQTFSGAMFGGYVDYTDFNGNGLLTGDADATSYGFTGGYGNQTIQAEANIGWTDASIAGVGNSSDWIDYGVNVSYTPTADTKIAGHWQLSDLNTNASGSNLASYGIGASHNFGAGFVGFGGISRVDFDAANVEATSYGIGASYDLRQISTVPAQISLELARTNLDAGGSDADVDTVRLGITIPLGVRENGAPLNSLADSIMAPRHNALSTLFDNIF
ncbi:hypothetical protein [Roseovarius arcticus]|uniref:hypothetical protein n=1 Tax=Roseovarius arcticus TaxID=2547404 RepID=UPI00111046B3|nr:hypothetical protein [Roseovarius arcticus]